MAALSATRVSHSSLLVSRDPGKLFRSRSLGIDTIKGQTRGLDLLEGTRNIRAIEQFTGRASTIAASEDGLAPVLQRLLHLVEELVGDRAVHHAVIVTQRDVAHRADGDGIVDNHGALFDSAKSQDADVRLADLRQAQ